MSERRTLLLIVVLSVVLRVGAALYLGDTVDEWRGGTADQVSYDALALRVTAGHGFSFPTDWWPYAKANQPTAFWSYLYTLILAGVYAVFGHAPLIARVLQAVAVGVAMPYLLFRLGRRAFGTRAGLLAAAIGAVYLYHIVYAASLMSEALYIVGILWLTDTVLRLRAALESGRRPWPLAVEFGLAVALTILLRQVVMAFLLPLGLWMMWKAWRGGRLHRAIPALALATAIVLLLISPVLVRNQRVFGQATLINTNAGFTLFWSNHPIYGTRFEATLSPAHGMSYQELVPEELRHLSEAALDRALLGRAVDLILAEPVRFIRLSLSRIPVFFLFWPTAESSLLSNLSRVLSFALFLPFMLYGVGRGVVALRRGELAPAGKDAVTVFLLFIVVYTGVHLVSWANVRYRLPVDAFLIVFAAYGIEDLWNRVRGRTARVRRSD